MSKCHICKDDRSDRELWCIRGALVCEDCIRATIDVYYSRVKPFRAFLEDQAKEAIKEVEKG